MKLMRKVAVAVLVAVLALVLVACGNKEKYKATTYTYKTYASALSNNWNPHTWETNADSGVLGYITSPFVDLSIKDSKTGEYQWVYEMAESITNVTVDHLDDLTTYKSTVLEGYDDVAALKALSAEQKAEVFAKGGYVFEIALNRNAKWENGEVINADTYVKSMQYLLAPDMHNYRANNYLVGEAALAGAENYYYQGSIAKVENAVEGYLASARQEDGSYKTEAGLKVFFALNASLAYLNGKTLKDYNDAYGAAAFDQAKWAELYALADEEGCVQVTAETYPKFVSLISDGWEENEDYVDNYVYIEKEYAAQEWSTVGLYKVDDYTIRYVTQDFIDLNYFLTAMTDNWIVYEPYYTAGFDTTGKLKTTNYNSKLDTTMSYGPYKFESLQADKQMVFVQNENWYGYTGKDENGNLYSETNFLVDGKKVRQYQTTKVVLSVMENAAAKQAFLKGDLDDWAPEADELVDYSTSPQLYKVDETYMMRLFFNTGLEALQTMDASKGNKNSVVMSNINFRKAFSLAINRADWVSATAGYKPGYYLINYLYFYDVYDNPKSVYRQTPQAKKAVVDLYGVQYGEGKAYATLDEAYDSINGYNLTEAKALMKQACDELVAANLYTAGQEIKIRVAYKKGALENEDQKQVQLFENYLNAAVEGSGFGKVTLEAVGNLDNRYNSVATGDFAIGYGAWGGAAFYPFTMFRVYMDPSYTSIHERGCWSPETETLTLNIDGEDVTMTYQQWSNSMAGSGKYTNASFETKLNVLSALEKDYLSKYYCIPLATSTACSMLSYKMNYYTEDYNIMYGFGGLRLLSYNYTDGEWAKYVDDHKGALSYN